MSDGRVADSTGNWVDSLAPSCDPPLPPAGPRRSSDRRVAAAVAVLVVGRARGDRRRRGYPTGGTSSLFFVGAVVMRGAGCTWNDIVDRDLDAKSRARVRGRFRPAR